MLVPPSTDPAQVVQAIGRLELAEPTAIGEGVLASLDAIESAPIAADGVPVPAHILVLSDGETQVGTPNELAAAVVDEACSPTPRPSAVSPRTTWPKRGSSTERRWGWRRRRSAACPPCTAGGRDTIVYPKPEHTPAGYTISNFPVGDIDDAVDELVGRGVSFERYVGFGQDDEGIARGEGPDIAWFGLD